MKVINLNPLLLDHVKIAEEMKRRKSEDAEVETVISQKQTEIHTLEAKKLDAFWTEGDQAILDTLNAELEDFQTKCKQFQEERALLDTFTRFKFSVDPSLAQVFDMGQQAGNKIYRIEFIQDNMAPGAQVEWPWAMVQLGHTEEFDLEAITLFASNAIFTARTEELKLREQNGSK